MSEDLDPWWTEVTVADVMIRMADSAGVNFEEDLASLNLRHWQVFDYEWLILAVEHGGFVGLGEFGTHSC